jgi:DMSO/TMAO reductase YedYZ heme-binding membrane subunit
MNELLTNIRFYILVTSVTASLIINFVIITTIPSAQLQTIRLNQIYGLISMALLYLALLAGPFCYMFANFPWKKQYLKARRAIGVSAFYFAALHSLIAFFGQLNGFEGLSFLTTNYQIALGVSAIALFILMLQAMTSFDAVIKWMTFPRWKILQRFVYVASIFTLIHVVMLGTHFQDLTGPIARIAYLALAFLFFLEALRIDAWLQRLFKIEQKFSYGTLLIGGLLISGILYIFSPLAANNASPFGVHQQHSQSNSQQQANINTQSKQMMASMQGDRTLRYTVSLDKEDVIVPNQETTLMFSVYNAATGNENTLFQKLYEKEAHLIILDNKLQYFNHIHPQKSGNSFTINTSFPEPGVYRAYLTYQPVGAVEQQVGFSFIVGSPKTQFSENAEQIVDTNMAKTVGQYEINLSTGNGLVAKDMEQANALLTFTIKDANSKQPIQNLKPYLGAFGHMIMVNTKDYSYLHVHPVGVDPEPNAKGGPEVSFAPMPLNDPIKPGVYRVFAEFNPNGKLFVADYTVQVK